MTKEKAKQEKKIIEPGQIWKLKDNELFFVEETFLLRNSDTIAISGQLKNTNTRVTMHQLVFENKIEERVY